MEIPFDNGHPGTYRIDLYPEQAGRGDGMVLAADRAGFLALAEVFRQMASAPDGTHLHLGYAHDTPPGPGWRLVLTGP